MHLFLFTAARIAQRHKKRGIKTGTLIPAPYIVKVEEKRGK